MQITDSELTDKWSATGLLRGVRDQHQKHVAERLERALRRSLREVDVELAKLDREGLFVR